MPSSIKELAPVKETDEDYDRIEKEIARIFKEEIYLPLIQIMKDHKIKNSINDLADAIISKKITYENGAFTGKFNVRLSVELKKLGAKWDRRHGRYSIPLINLPMEIKQAIAMSELVFQKILQLVEKKISQIIPEKVAERVSVKELFGYTLDKTDAKLRKSMRSITIEPKLTDYTKDKISSEYENNLKLYIRDFTEKETVRLRKQMQDNAFKGLRYEEMIDTIQKSYGVSKNKAKFLARQETNLLMVKYKESRYREAGVKKYKWGCVKMPHQTSAKAEYVDGDVRYYHGIHEGKIFTWDDPPVVNAKRERKHPGQDYNCRCFAIPIVEFDD